MSIIVHDVQISHHMPTSFKFNINPKYIRNGKLSLERKYEVGCFTGGRGTVFLKNRQILARNFMRKGKEYTEYRISIPKQFVDHGVFLLGVDYTLELF